MSHVIKSPSVHYKHTVHYTYENRSTYKMKTRKLLCWNLISHLGNSVHRGSWTLQRMTQGPPYGARYYVRIYYC